MRFHRRQAKLTQAELARLASVGKTVIFDVEHGKPGVRLNTLLKILAVLNVSVSLASPLMPKFEQEEAKKHAPS